MRSWVHAVFGLVFAATLTKPGYAADLGAMQPSEIEALQKRLLSAGCYTGTVDGKASNATVEAMRACPDQEPTLRIETGMHIAMINRIGVDRSCRMIATGSDDKTVRLWSMPEGRLIHTERLPIGPGNDGKIYAVAMSLDGKSVVAAGWDAARDAQLGHGVYLFDTATGTAVRRIGSFDNVVNHLAFSPDGSKVAAGLGGSEGVRVLDVASGSEIMADRDYEDKINGLAFAPDGALIVGSYDGTLHRYDAEFNPTKTIKTIGGKQAFSIAVDPSGKRVAVGFKDGAAVDLYDARTLRSLGTADMDGVSTDSYMDIVTWSQDGTHLYAGGTFGRSGRRLVRTWTPDGSRDGPDVGISNNTIMSMMPCGTAIAFGASDPSFGLLKPGSRAVTLGLGPQANMIDKLRDAFTVSPDGKRLRFGLDYGEKKPVLFDLVKGELTDAPEALPDLAKADIEGLPVSDWEDKAPARLGSRDLELDDYELSRSLAVRPSQDGFVLGTDWSLRSYDAAGKQRWVVAQPGMGWGVNMARSGALVLVADDDGTIRWHRWSDGQELLALFVNKETHAWVAWTPSGYYMASPGGENMIGWHLNRGWSQEADFFPASRFSDKFSRPDVVRLVLDTMDEAEAVKRANAASQRPDDSRPLIERLPPVITITSPTEGSDVAPGTVEIRFRTRSPSGIRIDRVEAFVDGAKVGTRDLAPASPGSEAASPTGESEGSIALTMPARDAVVSLVAYADGKASDAAQVALKEVAPAAGRNITADATLKPTLYALVIGVSHYQTKDLDLAFPAKDAAGLAEALKGQDGKLYRHVEIKMLTDADATATGVKRGFSWLDKQMTPRDLAVVFAAGHGATDNKGRSWFLPYDADPKDVTATALSRDDIAKALVDLPGKKLLFLDACHAEAAPSADTRTVPDAGQALNAFTQAEGGVVAYTACTGHDAVTEHDDWSHGAFTQALIEGFGGKADLMGKGTVTTATLDSYLAERVKALTGGQQHPVMSRPNTVPDFPIASLQ